MHTKNKTIQLTNTSINSIDSEIEHNSAVFEECSNTEDDRKDTLSLATTNDETDRETTEMVHLPDEE